MKTKLYYAIIDWIRYNYGSSEAEEPCYDIGSLVDMILNFFKGGEK